MPLEVVGVCCRRLGTCSAARPHALPAAKTNSSPATALWYAMNPRTTDGFTASCKVQPDLAAAARSCQAGAPDCTS
jgi:hypothetical protein